MFLRKITIRARLMIGIGFLVMSVTITCLVAIGFMGRLSEVTTKLYRHPYTVSTAILRIDANVERMHSAMKDVMLASNIEAVSEASETLNHFEQLVLSDLEIVTERFLGDPQQVEELKKLFAAWRPIRDEEIGLVADGEKELAIEITLGKGADHVARLNQSLEGLIGFAGEKAESFNNNAVASSTQAIGITAALLILSILVGSLVVLAIIRSIVKTLGELINVTDTLSQGDLDVIIDTRFNDEVSTLATSYQRMVENLQAKVELAKQIAEGNLDVEVELSSSVDRLGIAFKNMLSSMRTKVKLTEQISMGDLSLEVDLSSESDTLGMALGNMVENLNNLLSQVASTAESLKSGSGQIASSSQSLSQGASEQASSLEEISSSMEELEGQTRSNSENAQRANQQASDAKQQSEGGNLKMQQMLEAMNEINVTAEQISNIIKTIDEIAFQTNVLAINAAVEAARAGEHGKGFAVVAEEVRNLAQRSADASKETTLMINNSIKKIEVGVKIADETARSLSEITKGSAVVTELVEEISSSSNEQALGVSQINQGLSQLNQIVQTNASIAEQSASASEELDAQANNLKQLVARFKLKSQYANGQGTSEVKYQEDTNIYPSVSDDVGYTREITYQENAPQSLRGADIISFDEEDTALF